MEFSPEMKRKAKQNPRVDMDLLQRALKEQESIVVEQAKYNLEPPFSRQGLVKLAHSTRRR